MTALDWQKLPRPIIALSPMADMTDSAFCRVVREVTEQAVKTVDQLEASVKPVNRFNRLNRSNLIVFREMVSAEAVVRRNNKTLGMTDVHADERPLVQQIFGSDPAMMAQAAKMIADEHNPEGFDINMGCPVYKIVHNFNGAALMQNAQLAGDIVRAMKAVIHVPLSVKIRLGWDDPTECVAFAQALESAGADLLTVHGRTKMQGYSGTADWKQVGEVKKVVGIPVLVNGDIHTAEKVVEALNVSQCDGVLIARGALGNPWIFAQIDDVLNGKPARHITFGERMRVVRRHLELHLEQYGPDAVPTFRKHLSWYFKGMPQMKRHKDDMMKAKTPVELETVFRTFATDHDAYETRTFRPSLFTSK